MIKPLSLKTEAHVCVFPLLLRLPRLHERPVSALHGVLSDRGE